MVVRRLSSREKNILIACIAITSIYIGYNFVFKSLYARVSALKREIAVRERKLKNNLRIIKRESLIDEQYDKYVGSLAQTTSDEKEMTSIVSEISSVAGSVDLRVADLKPKRVKKVDFYNNFSVSLTVDGDLTTIIHFLHILQNSPHLFDIEEVRLDKGSIRSSKIKCLLVLRRALIP